MAIPPAVDHTLEFAAVAGASTTWLDATDMGDSAGVVTSGGEGFAEEVGSTAELAGAATMGASAASTASGVTTPEASLAEAEGAAVPSIDEPFLSSKAIGKIQGDTTARPVGSSEPVEAISQEPVVSPSARITVQTSPWSSTTSSDLAPACAGVLRVTCAHQAPVAGSWVTDTSVTSTAVGSTGMVVDNGSLAGEVPAPLVAVATTV